jgi:8-oxo-dGTP pyrophosphatase MutT (NUDIX family)
MDKRFTDFITSLKAALNEPLPGQFAQYGMAPYERVLKVIAKKLATQPTKESAVLCLFYPKDGEPHFVLILRNTYKGTHSAQVGLPGGKAETWDADFEETALRETEEEVGVDRKLVTIIGALTEVYIPPSGYQVHPFVGYTSEAPLLVPDPTEVSAIIEAPLSTLMDDSIVGRKKIRVSGAKLKVNYPYFDIMGNTVWGATAMMLNELKEVIRQGKLHW